MLVVASQHSSQGALREERGDVLRRLEKATVRGHSRKLTCQGKDRDSREAMSRGLCYCVHLSSAASSWEVEPVGQLLELKVYSVDEKESRRTGTVFALRASVRAEVFSTNRLNDALAPYQFERGFTYLNHHRLHQPLAGCWVSPPRAW